MKEKLCKMKNLNNDKHETSHHQENCANYPHHTTNDIIIKRHESLGRRCNSDSELQQLRITGNYRIINSNRRMGIRVSRRWKSVDNVAQRNEEFIVYRPLSKVNVLVNENEDEIEDYELLESSSADDNENDNIPPETISNCHYDGHLNETTTIEQITPPSLFKTVDNCDDFVIRKFSTLPRAKSRESIVRCENAFRKSCKLSSLNRSSEKLREKEEKEEQEKSNVQEMVVASDTSMTVMKRKSDKKLFHESTTLPKQARSRLFSEGARRSLRNTNNHIDLQLTDNSSRNYSSNLASGNNATISTPTNSEPPSGTGKFLL